MAAGLDGVAALPVWANAEIVKVTATARRTRRNLLVIGSVELLGTCFGMLPGMNFRIYRSLDRFFSQRWAALNEVSAAVAAAVGKGALDCQHHTPSPAGVPSTPHSSLDGVDH